MRSKRMANYHHQLLLSHRNIVVVFVVMILACAGTQAQSGRRAPKGTKTVPTISGPREVEKPPASVKDARISLAVAIEEHNAFSGIPYYLAGTVRDTCAVHLRASSSVKVDIVARSMSRSEAVKRAKAEKETYVVWLQIESDAFDRSGSSSESPESLYVRYTVFTPVTRKVKTSGRTSQIYRNGRGGVLGRIPTSRGTSIYSEYALKQAAREVAEQVLEAFSVHPPDSRLPY